MGEFYGQSFLAEPHGNIVVIENRNQDEVIIEEIDKRLI
jgi:beta-ureidopropionase